MRLNLARGNRRGTPLVLDAWPIMEWFRGREPAASAFSSLLTDAARGRISLSMNRDAALVTGDSDFQKLLPTESLRVHWIGA